MMYGMKIKIAALSDFVSPDPVSELIELISLANKTQYRALLRIICIQSDP